MNRLKVLFILLLLTNAVCMEGAVKKNNEDYHTKSIRLTSEDGLSDDSVTCMIQDKTGYIWLGTTYGLNRYDGYHFKVYERDLNNRNSLPDNWVMSLRQDRYGYIWVGTYNGLCRLDPRTDRIKRYPYDPEDPHGIPGWEISAVHEDPRGSLWFGTNKGLCKYHREKDSFIQYPMEKHFPRDSHTVPIPSSACHSISQDRSGRLWISNGRDIYTFNTESETYIPLETIYPRLKPFREYKTLLFQEDRNGFIRLGTHAHGLITFNPADGAVSRHTAGSTGGGAQALPMNDIRSLYETPSGEIWVGTASGGLHRYDESSDRFTGNTLESNRFETTGSDVRTIFEDHSGTIWAGAYSGGITRLVRTKRLFYPYIYDPGDPGSLSHNSVLAVYEDHLGVLWVGSHSGLNRYDPVTKKFLHYFHDPSAPGSLSHNVVRSIAEDRFGRLWVGTHRGLNRFNRETGSFTLYTRDPANPRSLSNNVVKKIYRDRGGVMWLGTANGLCRYDEAEDSFTRFMFRAGDPHGLSHKYVYTMLEDPDGSLWIGTRGGGLNRLDKARKRFTRVEGPSFVLSLYLDAAGALWIGSKSGLHRLDRRTGRFTRYDKTNGLPGNVVYSVRGDDDGYLWLAANNGLCQFHPQKGAVRNFGVASGIQDREYNGDVCFKSKTGRLYFGGIRGLDAFNPRELTGDSILSPIVPTSFRIIGDNERELPEALHRPMIRLGYPDRFFSFEFAVLDYRAPKRNRYAYMLQGVDKNWIYSANRNFATYTNLEPGTYVLKLKGADSSGIWTHEARNLIIRIIPPIWKTGWFRGSAFLVIVLAVLCFVRLRVNRVQNQKKVLESEVRERTGELKKKKDQLEKINGVVKAINAGMDFNALLESVLEETFKIGEVDRVNLLVYLPVAGVYEFITSVGMGDAGRNRLRLTPQEVNGRYIEGTEEVFEDIFIVENVEGRPAEQKIPPGYIPETMLVLRIRMGDEIPGYLVFDKVTAAGGFNKQSIQLFADLKDHIVSAFIKSKLLLELQVEREIAVEAGRSKGEFLARMSHEIRTPMNSVIGFTEMMLDTDLNTEQRDFARTIHHSGEVLLTLINDILDFSKVEAGELSLETIDFDIEDIAFGACELVLPRIADKPVDVLCRIKDDVPPFLNGDPGRFRQVLTNLLGNAVKFTEAGVVELSLEIVEARGSRLKLHVAVRDTGIGISADKLRSVFDVFQQADGSVTRKYGGSGLGLSISLRIARLMNGDITVESEAGKGSTFHFTSWLNRAAGQNPETVIPEGLAGRRVLFVDDNRNNLEILSHVLTRAGMRVTTMEDGAGVVDELVAAHRDGDPFELVILDIRMPGLSGYDLARRIRGASPGISRLPLLAYSSSIARQWVKCKEAGFDAFLAKPARRHKLLETISRLIEGVEVELQAIGAGTDAPAYRDVPETTIEAGEKEQRPVRLLLAEDNPINRKLAVFMFTRAGYDMAVVTNGREAVEKYTAAADAVDLILMDVQMPEMDGLEATREIRRYEKADGRPRIPIIAMTAQTMEGDREECLRAGMDDYIAKPIKRDVVIQIMEKWLAPL